MATIVFDRIEDVPLIRISGDFDLPAIRQLDRAIGGSDAEHAVLVAFEGCEAVDHAVLNVLAHHHRETEGRLIFVVPEDSSALPAFRHAAQEHRLHIVHSLEDGLRWARLISAFGWSSEGDLAL
ncbi:MAG: hypothetical protein WAN59_11150 [Candidatus Baltobacteraceae bacterium]|jgi:hypothetical protein